MMSNWNEYRMIDVCSKITDGTHDTPKLTATGVPYITAVHVKIGKIDFENCHYLPEYEHRRIYKRCNPEKDDLLIVNIGAGTATCARVKVDFEFSMKNVALLKPKQEIIKGSYLEAYQVFQKERLFHRLTSGGAQPFLSLKELGRLKIKMPCLNEQDAIASILQTWDTAIEKTEALIAAKEKLFQWFRVNILTGRTRIKGYTPPWKYQLFKNILLEHQKTSTGNEIVHSVSVHKGIINQIEHLGRSFAAQKTDNYNLVKPGDIVYTKSPTGKFPYGIIKQNKLQKNVIVSPLYGVFTPNTHELGVILDAYFESNIYTTNYLYPIIQKGAKNTINCTNKTFLSKGLVLPTDEKEEIAIVQYINTAKKEITLLKQEAELYRTQKRGLMQKLLTGEWRVKV